MIERVGPSSFNALICAGITPPVVGKSKEDVGLHESLRIDEEVIA